MPQPKKGSYIQYTILFIIAVSLVGVIRAYAPPHPPPPCDRMFDGIVLHAIRDFNPNYIAGKYYDEAKYWGAIQELGVAWVRVDISSNFQYIANQAHRRGIKVLGLINGATRSLDAWKNTVTSIKNTHGAYVDAFEILSEPNVDGGWRGGYNDGSVEHTFQLTKAASIILKPLGKPIVGLTMSPVNQLAVDSVIYAFTHGIGEYIDYLGLHNYAYYIQGGWHEAKLQIMVDAAYPTPIWFTELGCQDAPHPSGFHPTLEGQAQWIRYLNTYAKERQTRWRIHHVNVYKIADHHLHEEWVGTFGMLDGYLNPKPAYYALRDLCE